MTHPAVLVILAIIGILLLAVLAHSILLLFTAALCLAKVGVMLAPIVLVAFVIRWLVQRRSNANR
jgi:hypothetical protein